MKYTKYIIAIVAAMIFACADAFGNLPPKTTPSDFEFTPVSEPPVGARTVVERPQEARPDESKGSGDIDTKSIIFGHIGDSYEWHIADFGKKHIAMHLPIIVHSSTGWHCFSSAKLEDGEVYEGLYIAAKGPNEGKVVEINAAGEEVKPLNISITKNVLGLFINSALLVVLILLCARWYKRHDVLGEAPKGVAALFEPIIIMINDEVIKDSVGPEYKKYSPYLLTAFFFILINNLMGIIPFFPGGANLTGNIAITLVLALATFLCINLTTNKHYWKDIFWPDVPWWLKVPIPIMPLAEFLGMFTKPFALMIRLFANILAGHAMVLSIVCIIFLTVKMGPAMNGSLSVVSVLFGVFVDCLELLVAFIQAYVFTMLSAVFIGMSHAHPETEKVENK